jgi:hypothetical protein
MQMQAHQKKRPRYSTFTPPVLMRFFFYALLMHTHAFSFVLLRHSTVTIAGAQDKDRLNVKAFIPNLPHEAERRKSSRRMVLLVHEAFSY